MRNILLLNGKVVLPLINCVDTQGKIVVAGIDSIGEFLAYRLHNQKGSLLWNWYIYVSPEDENLVMCRRWCGCIANDSTISIRERHTANGVGLDTTLSQEVWRRMSNDTAAKKVYKHGHPLDYRRERLSLSHPGYHN